MSKCNAILKNGVFDTIVLDITKTLSESYSDWLKVASFEEIKQKMAGGLKIGLPIKEVPFELKADFSEDDYRKWQQTIDQGETRQLDSKEMTHLVEQSASPAILNAWSDCIGRDVFGLLSYEDEESDGSFSVMIRYSPDENTDKEPKIDGFDVIGAICVNAPSIGSTTVTFGGRTFLFSRQDNGTGFPAARYFINTSAGTVNGLVEEIFTRPPPPPASKIRGIRIDVGSGSVAAHPSAEVSVPAGFKLIGGGARINWQGEGNLLTSSFPVRFDTWRATGKDHQKSSPANIDVWAIAIEDPDDAWEVVIDEANSEVQAHPQRSIGARDGFQMVGGGARANWISRGQLLTASSPVGTNAWEGRSKDHNSASEPNTITVYCIAIRARNGTENIDIKIREMTTDVKKQPEGTCPVPDGCRLVGGGARVNWRGQGNLLTASYPEGDAWVAKAKDHLRAEAATMTVFSIGIPERYFGI